MAVVNRHDLARSVLHWKVEMAVGMLCVTAVVAWALLVHGGSLSTDGELTVPWWAVAAGFFAAEAWAVHVHFRSETHSISLSELALVPGLLFLPPHQLILAQLLGAGLALAVKRRQWPTKLLFNLASFVLSSSLAIAFLDVVGISGDLHSRATWAGVTGAAVLSSLVGIAIV
ncbi:MAG: hypothetical protein FJW96_13045, partial [Actinobacteria bacterium]|nr:hypothetical protein [Actinomycetota bacterium]